MYNHVKDWRNVKVPTAPNLNSTLSPMFAHGRQQKSLSVWLFGQQTTSNLLQKAVPICTKYDKQSIHAHITFKMS